MPARASRAASASARAAREARRGTCRGELRAAMRSMRVVVEASGSAWRPDAVNDEVKSGLRGRSSPWKFQPLNAGCGSLLRAVLMTFEYNPRSLHSMPTFLLSLLLLLRRAAERPLDVRPQLARAPRTPRTVDLSSSSRPGDAARRRLHGGDGAVDRARLPLLLEQRQLGVHLRELHIGRRHVGDRAADEARRLAGLVGPIRRVDRRRRGRRRRWRRVGDELSRSADAVAVSAASPMTAPPSASVTERSSRSSPGRGARWRRRRRRFLLLVLVSRSSKKPPKRPSARALARAHLGLPAPKEGIERHAERRRRPPVARARAPSRRTTARQTSAR